MDVNYLPSHTYQNVMVSLTKHFNEFDYHYYQNTMWKNRKFTLTQKIVTLLFNYFFIKTVVFTKLWKLREFTIMLYTVIPP